MKLSIDEIHHGLTSFPVDIRGEILINRSANKIGKETSLVLRSKGASKRKIKRDLTDVALNQMGDVEVALSRDSIYDSLPEGLFHEPLKTTVFKSANEMISEIHYNNKIEFESRKLFAPFDDALNWLRVFIEKKENVSIALEGSFIDLEDFCLFWNIPESIDRELISRLLWVYPVVPHFAGKKEKVEELLRSIFQVNLHIEEKYTTRAFDNPLKLNHFTYLGHTFCLGNTFNDDVPEWVVNIEVSSLEEYEQFSAGGTFFSAIKLCESLLFPADINPNYAINLKGKEVLVLGQENNAFLGACALG